MTTETIYVHEDEFATRKPHFIAKFCSEMCYGILRELGKKVPRNSPIKADIIRFNITFRLALARLGYLGTATEHSIQRMIVGRVTAVVEAYSKSTKNTVSTLQDREIHDFSKANPVLLMLVLNSVMKELYGFLSQDLTLRGEGSLVIMTLQLKMQEFTRIIKRLKIEVPSTEMDRTYLRVILVHTFVEVTTSYFADKTKK